MNPKEAPDDLSTLPNVQATHFQLCEDKLSVIIEGEKRQVTRFQIIGNATHDLCCYVNGKGKIEAGEICRIDKEKIVWTPLHDILIIELDKPLSAQGEPYAIFEIDEQMKEMVDEIDKRFPSNNGKDFDMYGEMSYGKSR